MTVVCIAYRVLYLGNNGRSVLDLFLSIVLVCAVLQGVEDKARARSISAQTAGDQFAHIIEYTRILGLVTRGSPSPPPDKGEHYSPVSP
eukprot:SAG31_NODE_2909_length_4921_cov_6.411240_6_plen_89_part_00